MSINGMVKALIIELVLLLNKGMSQLILLQSCKSE